LLGLEIFNKFLNLTVLLFDLFQSLLRLLLEWVKKQGKIRIFIIKIFKTYMVISRVFKYVLLF